MASGDPTLTNLGTHNISGASLKAAVDAITNYHPLVSGASLHFVPTANGQQVQLFLVRVEGTG